MNTRRTPLVLPAAFAALFAATWVFGGAPTSSREAVVHHVGGRVSYIENRGGNIGVLATEAGALVVDAQFAEVAQENEAVVRELAPAGPIWLVNTHWHPDHTGGNEVFAASAQIVAQTNVRRRLAGDATIGGRVREDAPAAALPTITYPNGVKLYFGGEEVRLVHVPHAHTDGDTVVHFVESNVIHMGDVWFQRGYPFIDLDSGGSVQGTVDGVEAVLGWAPPGARFITGHGEAGTAEDLREYLAMIREVRARVAKGLAEGQDVDALMAAGVTADYDARWSWDFIDGRKFVTALVRDAQGS
ncbi:MAG: MBL fold metallo-hydrolase [Planctomycetes bacterium]|nr:MBL fold metallo-hydrolase [Planctomycetota bacterium]